MSKLRKLRRSIAHASMSRAGLRRVNKWDKARGEIFPSFFSQNWREFDQPTVEIQNRAAAHLRELTKKKAKRTNRRRELIT